MSKDKTILNPKGATIRYHNRKILFQEEDGSLMIKFLFADKDACGAACYHKCHKGKVRETFIKMNSEAFHRIMYAYLEFHKAHKEGKFKTDESR